MLAVKRPINHYDENQEISISKIILTHTVKCQCDTEARQDFRKTQNMNWNGCGRFRWNGGFVDKRQMFALPWLQHSLTLQTPAPPEYKLLPNMVPAFALECRHCIPTICYCYSVRDSPEDSELTLYRLTLLTLAFFRSSKAWQLTNPPPPMFWLI